MVHGVCLNLSIPDWHEAGCTGGRLGYLERKCGDACHRFPKERAGHVPAGLAREHSWPAAGARQAGLHQGAHLPASPRGVINAARSKTW